MSPKTQLPPEFSDLESLADKWDVVSAGERTQIRRQASYEYLSSLYQTVLPRMDEILAYLAAFELGAFPPSERRLFRLLLGLCEASMTVEIFNGTDARQPADKIYFSLVRDLPTV